MNNGKANGAIYDKNQLVSNLYRFAADNNHIEPILFDRYSVKRGLRNKDGTGVLVGLTQIGDVHGYVIEDGKKVPGRPTCYRGIDAGYCKCMSERKALWI